MDEVDYNDPRLDIDRHWWRVRKAGGWGWIIEVGHGLLAYGWGWRSFGSAERAVAKAKRICDRMQRKYDRQNTAVYSGSSSPYV